ncbi:hypothetical protein CTAYLR_000444 [Chrysophaeum taylorii]|uniref:L domain-like protein n=1 Tax=Chrysophaeum taylorii TaxID=2483200 RepID=A0AAD7UGA3_9STRA|nr:hypothetical protein CTAYLR_000444 [Chrysophaeum taylorii]
MGASQSAPKNRTSTSVVKQKIERAGKTGILSLPEHKLKDVPVKLLEGLKANLKTLDVSSNSIEVLPEFGEYGKLKTLKVARNKLTRLPRLPSTLATLDAADNRLEEDLGDLPESLETLSLRSNSFGAVPRALLSLGTLKTLDLADCKLTDIAALAEASLASLLDLILDRNSIPSVPEGLVDAAPKLKRLGLEYNNIVHLPENLLRAPSLDRLDLKGNKLTKAQFMRLDGADDFLKRREKTRLKDTAGGAIADLAVCGLD